MSKEPNDGNAGIYSSKELFLKYFSDKELTRVNLIRHWNGDDVLNPTSVAEHTHRVTVNTIFLASILQSPSAVKDEMFMYACVMSAVFHDYTEIFDYDVNHNLKYNDFNGAKIRELIDEYGNDAMLNKCSHMASHFSILLYHYSLKKGSRAGNPVVKALVKVADVMDFLYFLNKQDMLGNKNFKNRHPYIAKLFYSKVEDLIKATRENESPLVVDRIQNLLTISAEQFFR